MKRRFFFFNVFNFDIIPFTRNWFSREYPDFHQHATICIQIILWCASFNRYLILTFWRQSLKSCQTTIYVARLIETRHCPVVSRRMEMHYLIAALLRHPPPFQYFLRHMTRRDSARIFVCLLISPAIFLPLYLSLRSFMFRSNILFLSLIFQVTNRPHLQCNCSFTGLAGIFAWSAG